MIKKIKRLWQLSKKKPEEIDVLLSLKDKEIELLEDEEKGKAVFFSEATDEDYEQFLKEESGLSKFYERIKKL